MDSSSPSKLQGGNLLHRKQLKMWMKRKLIINKKKKMWMLKRKKTGMVKRKKSRKHYEQLIKILMAKDMSALDDSTSAAGISCQWSAEDCPPVRPDVLLQELVNNQGFNSFREDYGQFRVSSTASSMLIKEMIEFDGSASAIGFTPATWDKDAYDQLKISASKLDSIEESEREICQPPLIHYTPIPVCTGVPPPVRSDVPQLELIKNRGLNSTTDYPPVPPGGEVGSESKPNGTDSKWNIFHGYPPKPRPRSSRSRPCSRSDVPPPELIKIQGLNSTRDCPPVPPGGEGGSETKPNGTGSKWNIILSCLGKNNE